MKPGDKVQIKSLNKSGVVVEIKGKKASVAIKNFTTLLPVDDLELISNKSKKQATTSTTITTATKHKSKVIDYHGKTVAETLNDLEQQISLAYQNNYSSLEVITGRGTGRLKAAVLDYLEKSDLKLNYQVSLNESVIYIYL